MAFLPRIPKQSKFCSVPSWRHHAALTTAALQWESSHSMPHASIQTLPGARRGHGALRPFAVACWRQVGDFARSPEFR